METKALNPTFSRKLQSRIAVQRVERILDRMGVTEALGEAGGEEGDTVFIGEAELEWR